MSPPYRVRRRGILLIELIALLGLLAAFSVILAALFKVAYRAEVDSARRDALLQRVDAAMGSLRRDTWNARELRMEGKVLRMTLADGDEVRWRWEQAWMRTETGAHASVTRWREMGAEPVEAEVTGPVVRLRLAESPREVESITFGSQVMLGRSK